MVFGHFTASSDYPRLLVLCSLTCIEPVLLASDDLIALLVSDVLICVTYTYQLSLHVLFFHHRQLLLYSLTVVRGTYMSRKNHNVLAL